MKYRRLTKEEFEEFHQEFIYFLSANTITGEDWKRIKEETPEKAEELLDMFSDIAFEKVLSQNDYVERIAEKEYMAAHFGDNQAEMILLRSTTGPLPTQMTSAEMKKALETKAIEVLTGQKSYSKLKEQEMFELIQQGATFSKGDLFKQLKSLL
ncbi:MAG: hypothetical protein HWD92_09715 [Flavobacteriia bacterium]|nr:hypothetical protein [Flavobacteriia bacterium]